MKDVCKSRKYPLNVHVDSTEWNDEQSCGNGKHVKPVWPVSQVLPEASITESTQEYVVDLIQVAYSKCFLTSLCKSPQFLR